MKLGLLAIWVGSWLLAFEYTGVAAFPKALVEKARPCSPADISITWFFFKKKPQLPCIVVKPGLFEIWVGSWLLKFEYTGLAACPKELVEEAMPCSPADISITWLSFFKKKTSITLHSREAWIIRNLGWQS